MNTRKHDSTYRVYAKCNYNARKSPGSGTTKCSTRTHIATAINSSSVVRRTYSMCACYNRIIRISFLAVRNWMFVWLESTTQKCVCMFNCESERRRNEMPRFFLRLFVEWTFLMEVRFKMSNSYIHYIHRCVGWHRNTTRNLPSFWESLFRWKCAFFTPKVHFWDQISRNKNNNALFKSRCKCIWWS